MARPRPVWTPPTLAGVSPSRVALPHQGPWPSLADFLAERLPIIPAATWRERLAAGRVLDAQGRALGPESPFLPLAVIWYWRELNHPEPKVPFEAEILHRDAHLLVVDKPHFLSMAPKGRHLHETVLVRLKQQLGIDTLVPLHRLDRETAGVVLFSIQPETRHAYHALFSGREIRKVYEAVAPWRADLKLPLRLETRLEEPLDEPFMQMRQVPGEPNATTLISLIERQGDLARYRLEPLTGRRHQLRVQLNALGLPMVGDRIYPTLWPEPALDAPPDFSNPLRLVARAIHFTDPLSGAARSFESQRVCAFPAEPTA
ncbi:MAG: pseudouridine synthase [Leptothrix ochracea]|uniref:pseudouridine synthase n=1 Tax=Leptothrix ochracea TaxID=735331 RepID=UPI0034E23A17